jgi:ferredoxin/coenzyme F420-reducing hydrogenase delta subunit
MGALDLGLSAGLAAWRRIDRCFDAAFGSALNPLRHLGAIGMMSFGLLAASGVYLFAVLDTSVAGAYRSIEQLSHAPWYAFGWLRSLHRYAADVFVIAMGLHLLRELLHRRWRGFRRFSWLTGVPLVVFAFVSAIGGFWLNWDQLGAYSAQATAEWFDAWPLLAVPLARNFLTADAVGDRLFSLFVFVHLGVPLLMVFGLWFHIQRMARVAVVPPRALAIGLAAVLVALALAWPVAIHPSADLATIPAALALDWILLFVHPLVAATSPAGVWLLVVAFLVTLLVLPYLPQPARSLAARVDPAHCTGCRRCFDDCPFTAVTMVKHPLPRIGKALAQVNADLCAGCGLCTGACPSSTPSPRAASIATGIDMPQRPIGEIWARVREGLAARAGRRPVVVFGCDRAARVERLASDKVIAAGLICAGMLPPSFVDFALRAGAAGVLVVGCREAGCEFRLGQRWTAQRLAGRREPHLHPRIAASQVALAWTDAGDAAALDAALADLQQRVADPSGGLPAHG